MFASMLPMLIRYAISALGTYLVTAGYFSEDQFAVVSDQAQILIGAVLAIAPVIYAAWKRPSAKALDAAKEIDKARADGNGVVVKTAAGAPVTTVPPKASAIPTTSRSR